MHYLLLPYYDVQVLWLLWSSVNLLGLPLFGKFLEEVNVADVLEVGGSEEATMNERQWYIVLARQENHNNREPHISA